MKSSPVETPETPYPHNMNSEDAVRSAMIVEEVLTLMMMQYNVDGSIMPHMPDVALTHIGLVTSYLVALGAITKPEDLPF